MKGPSASNSETAVTPVLGSILVLAITVVGIAGVLFWGAPTIDRIQTRNAQIAMQGEFSGLRDSTLELSVPDHSRFPTIALPGGKVALAEGTRFLVAANRDPSNTACDLHITDWSDTGGFAGEVTVFSTGCRTPTVAAASCATGATPAATAACLEIYTVGGSSTVKQTVTSPAAGRFAVAGADFSTGDWMFRLTNNAATPTIYADAWLHSTDQLAWKLESSTTNREAWSDGGAVFSRIGDNFFLEDPAPIGDTSFGNGYYGLWLRSLIATAYSELEGQGTHQVYFALLGNAVRVDSDTVYKLRFDFAGALAQPWCDAILSRNGQLTSAAYAETAGFTCATGDANGLRSLTYTCSDAVACPAGVFEFRFLHARIHTSLVV